MDIWLDAENQDSLAENQDCLEPDKSEITELHYDLPFIVSWKYFTLITIGKFYTQL